MGYRPEISPRQRLFGWFRLLRLPNLLTVPGDPMAGMAAATLLANQPLPGPGAFFLAGASALCFYAFGLILNDLVDYGADRQQRPDRPLPRGEVEGKHALLTGLALLALGLLLAAILSAAALVMGALLAFLICLYNLVLKRYAGLACLNMGLCRGTSFLLGVEAAGWASLPAYAAVGLTAYVAALTWIARHEDFEHAHGRCAWYPLLVLAALAPAVVALGLLAWTPLVAVPVAAVLLLALVSAARTGWQLGRGRAAPGTTRRAVGALIRNLLPIQAAFLLLLPHTAPIAVLLMLCWPLAGWLGKRFSPT